MLQLRCLPEPILSTAKHRRRYARPESNPGGESFYDDPGAYARYTAYREDRQLSPNHVMEEPAFLTEVGNPAGLRVLDLGCGDGAIGKMLLAAGAHSYLGVDNSHRMVEQATRVLAGTTGQVALADIKWRWPISRTSHRYRIRWTW